MKTGGQKHLIPVSLFFMLISVVVSYRSLPRSSEPGIEHPLAAGFSLEPRNSKPLNLLSSEEKKVRTPAGERTEIASPLSPEMDTFRQLRRKALRTNSEIYELKRLRHNRAVISRAFAQVLDQSLPATDRQAVVSFLQEALSDNENPEADFIASKTEEVLRQDNLSGSLPKDLRLELAADKGELALSYFAAYPERTAYLLEVTSDTASHRVLLNALKVGERRNLESLEILREMEAASN